jgi:hypothetical protein
MKIRSLDFGRCYLLTATMFASLTDDLILHKIRRLDVSGCTWIPSALLVRVIGSMADLEELCLSDTRVKIANLLEILPRCRKITNISFPFYEDWPTISRTLNLLWNDEDAQLSRCFNQMKSVKITCVNSPERPFWAVVTPILE